MKTNRFQTLFALTMTTAIVLSLLAFKTPKDDFKSDFTVTWNNLKDYSLKVADALPADKYNYKPKEEIRDFAAQLRHVSFTFYYMVGVFIDGNTDLPFDPNYNENVELVGGTKSEIISLLSERFDEVDKKVQAMSKKELQSKVVLPFFENKEVTKQELIVWVKNHASHHMSQSIIYLRMNDIIPPAYNGW